MKKLLFAFPIVALLAAGCNSSQQATIQRPVTQNTNPVSSISAVNPTPTATTSTNSNTTTGWKTYVASDFGFQIDYPSQWQVSPASEQDQVKEGYQFSNYKDSKTDFYAFIVTRNMPNPPLGVSVTLANGMNATEYDNKSDNTVTEQIFTIHSNGDTYNLDFQVHHSNITNDSGNPPVLTSADLAIRDGFIKSFKVIK